MSELTETQKRDLAYILSVNDSFLSEYEEVLIIALKSLGKELIEAIEVIEFYGNYYDSGKTFSDFAKEEQELDKDGNYIPHGKRARQFLEKHPTKI